MDIQTLQKPGTILALLIASILFLFVNILVAISVAYFFNFSNIATTFTKYFFLCLSAAFIVSIGVIHLYNSWIINTTYIILSVWVGIFFKLFIATILLWGLFLFFPEQTQKWGSIVYYLSFVYAIYGIWNAQRIQEKRMDVYIPNLPDKWHNKKVVHVADLHLGIIYQSNFLKRVIKKINRIKPSAVFITGDLVDGVRSPNIKKIIKHLSEIQTREGVFFITGNHEYLYGIREINKLLEDTPIIHLDNQKMEIDGLEIIGISHHSSTTDFDFESTLSAIINNTTSSVPQILLYHEPIPSDSMIAEKKGIDLQLSGHTHYGQMFPLGWITQFFFGKYDYGLHRNGDFQQYTTAGLGTWGPPLRSSSTPEIAVIKLHDK